MEELSRIQARLESLEELGDLVGALRSMAGVRAGEAREALTGTRAYCDVVQQAIGRVAPMAGEVPAEHEGKATLVVITSENGFVGGFNTRLVEQALSVRAPDEDLVIVGRRGRITAGEMGVETAGDFAMASRSSAVTPLARRLSRALSDTVGARLLFARMRGGADYELVTEDVLPLRHLPDAPAPSATPPLTHLPPDLLRERLATEYLFAKIADAVMESLASESLARLRTMDAASHNIEVKLDKLHRDEHIARQEKTTADLLDVVVGSEAARQ